MGNRNNTESYRIVSVTKRDFSQKEPKKIGLPNAYYSDVFELQLRMDAPASDALAHLELTNNAHAEIIERLSAFKNNYPLFFKTTEESSNPIGSGYWL